MLATLEIEGSAVPYQIENGQALQVDDQAEMASSVVLADSVQADGRRRIVELHTDDLGVSHLRTYLAESGQDVQAGLPAAAGAILVSLADNEVSANLANALSDGFMPPTYRYCTPANCVAGLRELIKAGSSFVLCRLAWYLRRLNLTDNQLKAAFGVGDAGLVIVKAKLEAWAVKYEDILLQQGE